MVQISNGIITASISEVGAEVQSLRCCKSGREYMWHGDAKWWNGHSPILFPIVGGLWNGTCRIDGAELQISKHGFVRRATWRAIDVQTDRATFEICSTVGTFKVFPYAFRLTVTYTLDNRTLKADFSVHNPSGCDLWFQLGGHPAIVLPDWDESHTVDGYLQLEGNPTHVLRAGEQGCLEPDTYSVPADADGLIPISVETFSHEALIFENHEVTAATVLDRNRQPVARVACNAPAWLFWSPQGVHTPFVCCEPWYGLCDHQGFNGSVSERPYINCVHGGQTWQGEYSISAN